jgi:tetratricopeptide (TPR) repeat protein
MIPVSDETAALSRSMPESTGLPNLPPAPPASAWDASTVTPLLGAPVSPDALADSPPGYTIVRRLGRGAMGDVFLAHHASLNRFVALKMMPAGSGMPELRARLSMEAGAIARLHHPNIVQIFEVGETAGGPFLALEFAEGGSLQARLARAPQPPLAAARLVETLARAAHHAHERGIVHRDLKPANVLLVDADTPKITDFGLAHDLTTDAGGGIVGTPGYMAPEQAGGTGDIGARTDVYSLGAILYECLTGRPPFAELTMIETLAAVRERDPLPVRQLRPATPRDIATICETCLRKDPPRRYASAADLADDLGRFLRGEPIAARPVGRVERIWKWARRRPVVAALSALSAAALVTLLVGGAIYQYRLQEANRRALRQQARAEENYHKALDAVERLLTRVGNDRLAAVPEMEGVRAELLQDALGFYQGFLAADADPDPAIRWETAQAFARVGRIQAYLGRSDDSARHYRQAIDRLGALAAEFPDRTEYRAGLADAHQQFGVMLGNWAGAGSAGDQFDRARRLWQDLADAAPDSRHYRTQVATCDHLEGWWHAHAGRLADAEKAYEQSLIRRRQLLADAPTDDDARLNLGMTLHNLAMVSATTGRPDAALRYEDEAVGLIDAVARIRPNDEETQKALSGGLHNLGFLDAAAHRFDDAWRCHERALAVREGLARAHPSVPGFQDGVAQSCMALAGVALEQQRPPAAEPYAVRAVAIFERLNRERPRDAYGAEVLLGAQTNLALLYQSTNRPDDAMAVYSRALAVAEQLIRDHPDNLHYLTGLAGLCNNRGSLDKDRNRPFDALPWYERAIRAAGAALAKDGRIVEAQTWRRYAHGSRAQAYEQLHDYPAAIRDWDRVVDGAPAAELSTYRLMRLPALAKGGAYDRLDEEVTALATDTKDSAALQHLAEACAAAATLATTDDLLSDVQRSARAAALATRASSLLQLAIANADFKRRGEILLAMITNPDLRTLNNRR